MLFNTGSQQRQGATAQQTLHALHCRVLPPGKFTIMICIIRGPMRLCGVLLGVCLAVTFVYCVETARDTAMVATEWETVPNLSNGTIFNNLDRPLTKISRSRYYLTLNISKTYEIETQLQWNTNSDVHMSYSMVSFRMILSDMVKYSMTRSIAAVPLQHFLSASLYVSKRGAY